MTKPEPETVGVRAANDRCTCAEVSGEDPRCKLHGIATDWALENMFVNDWQACAVDLLETVDMMDAKARPTPTSAPIESTLADAIYGIEEALQTLQTSHPSARRLRGVMRDLDALRTPPQSGEVSREQVEAGKLADELHDLIAEAEQWYWNPGLFQFNPPRFEDRDDLWTVIRSKFDRLRIALNSPPPPSVEVGLAQLAEDAIAALIREDTSEVETLTERLTALRQQPIGVVEDGPQDRGITPSGPGCQPTASAAVPASSQSGIPDAYDAHPGQLEVVARQIESWLEWSQTHRQSEGLTTKDGTHIMALPVPCWPSHGMFRNWITLFRAVAQRIEARSDETAKQVRPEGREPDGEADAPKDSGHAH
jgi:hypothetical protein